MTRLEWCTAPPAPVHIKDLLEVSASAPRPSAQRSLVFQLDQYDDDQLRLAVKALVEAGAECWEFLQNNVRLVPRTTLQNKLPYHRATRLHPDLVVPSAQQEWVLRTQGSKRENRVPVASWTRRRPRYAVRDAYVNHVVTTLFLVNAALVWGMFSVDTYGARLN